MIDAEVVCKAANHSVRVRVQSCGAIQQVLGRVIRGVAHERFRVDDEPWRPTCAKNIPRVQVCRQQYAFGRALRQFFEEAQTLTDEAGIRPAFGLSQRLFAPVRHHR